MRKDSNINLHPVLVQPSKNVVPNSYEEFEELRPLLFLNLDRAAMATMRTLTASSTGDLSNNVDKLRHELQHSKYVGPIDARAWRKGNP